MGPRCTPALRSWLGGSTGAPVYVLGDDSGGSWSGATYAWSLWTVGRPPSLITPASRMMDR
ncbi:hypothetical protein [Pseudonocardia alni]|uniref:hypothetical protein n=1 Tax=Pseudonocardia alni TaxID=33907 RepID=UPI0006CB15F5|nr:MULTISPECIES: hypothetical protein [Pseudonocardia]ALE81153.1 hypothetical protein WY02_25310 [Pseudonocardia sp. AL041005-10]